LIYLAGIRCYSFFNSKAKKWINGRVKWQQKMGLVLVSGEKRIWMHCSSLGEFEQGRPLIEALKKKYPDFSIVLSFFSPSGYEIRKDYIYADYVFYMPLDGKKNARQFIKLVKPSLAIFVKYEFWYYYLEELHNNKIPTIIISAAFRKEQTFFSWYGKLFRSLLHCFNWIFVQDEQSKKLLEGIGLEKNISISGDTRYDRVSTIVANRKPLEVADRFRGDKRLIIAGSTWQADEKILKLCINALTPGWKLVIAPHEIDPAHIETIQNLFGEETVLYSTLQNEQTGFEKRILIIDNIGLLSSLFGYGEIAFIGGGFQKGGIHNVLEPAVFGLPVIFGPIYEKFIEARKLVSQHLAFPVQDADECRDILSRLINDTDYRATVHLSLKRFIQENTGATNGILQLIEDEKWLL
jgi:3-deoxy-D-manno-octulosonic-acid transferase